MFPLLAAAIAVIACLVVGKTAGIVVRLMRPAQAVVLLAAASLAVSLASGITLTAIAIAVIASLTSVAREGHWSASVIRTEVPIPGWIGALAALAVLILLARAAVRTTKILIALVRADRLCRQIRAGGGPVVMVDDDSADAYTVAGIRGCVVISQRLFTALNSCERRVLTSHELSHLKKRHHLYVHIADIAAAANPLLKPVSGAVRLGVERWADEDAAAGIGDRRLAGRALARVALMRSALAAAAASAGLGGSKASGLAGAGRAIPVLGIGALQVASRVQALLVPAPRGRTGRFAIAIAMSLAVLVIGLASMDHIQDAIRSADPYLHHRHHIS